MALPMVHLSVAHDLVCTWGYRPAPAFYLGSIAPDAIHMRPGTGGEDKRAVHLSQNGTIDLSRVQQLITECGPSSEDTAFAEGYGVHLLTDYYWFSEFVESWRARLDGHMPRHELRILYYNECDKIDLELYDRQPWRDDVWALLRSAETSDFKGLLARKEIEMWRERVLSWFDQNRHKKEYRPRYISQQMVLDFVSDASIWIHKQMALWKEPVTGSRRSCE